MISSIFSIMANAVRPPLRSSNERQTRLNFLPVSRDDAHAQRTSNTTIATRRTSRSGPLLALAGDEKSNKQITHTPAKPAPPARTHSRKRPAAALEPDATDTRPPTKIVVTQPHGELQRITNGVAAPLGIDADDVHLVGSTPRPGSSGKLAALPISAPASTTSSQAQDKRSLRSHDGGSRLKSDLAIYFSNYDDIIAGVPKPAGMASLCRIAW
jgi:hypothetical protein